MRTVGTCGAGEFENAKKKKKHYNNCKKQTVKKHNLGRVLQIRTQNQTQKQIHVSLAIIQVMAKLLYEDFEQYTGRKYV
jgi:hypothetical protein